MDRQRDPASTEPMSGGAKHPADGDASPQRIKEQIDQTRARMDNTLAGIRQRLQPESIAVAARNWVARSVRGNGRHPEGRPTDRGEARATARRTAEAIGDVLRRHPLSIALIGAGIALWIYERNRAARQETAGPTVPREMQPVPQRTPAEPIAPDRPAPDVAAQRATGARTAAERRAAEDEVERAYSNRPRSSPPPDTGTGTPEQK